mmetsp:Transcript_62759/g.178367  ORF Transcript_62759/g.178367 Transcript_62759/m.178367 type:complete len:347 (-) Transcript_62759:590-1630(-)
MVQPPEPGVAAGVAAFAEDEPLPRLVEPRAKGRHLEEHIPHAAEARANVPDHATGLRAPEGDHELGGCQDTQPFRAVDLEAVQPELRQGHQGYQRHHTAGRGARTRQEARRGAAVRRQPAPHRRLQVRPADLRGGPLLRPPEGLHQRRGPRPPGDGEVFLRAGDPAVEDHAPHQLFGQQVLSRLRPKPGRRGARRGGGQARRGDEGVQVVPPRTAGTLRPEGPELRSDVRSHQGRSHQGPDSRGAPYPRGVGQGAGGRPLWRLGRARARRSAPRELLRDVRLRRAGGRPAEAVAAGGEHLPLALLRLAPGQADQDQVCRRHFHLGWPAGSAQHVAPDRRPARGRRG